MTTAVGELLKVEFYGQATKDGRNLAAAGLQERADDLIALLEKDPSRSPPPFEELSGKLAGTYSRRINIQHRLVYEVYPDRRLVRVTRMWGHYE